MAKIIKFPPKADDPKAFIEEFVKNIGDDMTDIIMIAKVKDGSVVNGWSAGFSDNPFEMLGVIEEFKIDFWDSTFYKRSDEDA